MTPRFWISLTTTPSRIGRIRPALDALTRQTGRFEGILLNVPYSMRRNGAVYDVPGWLNQLPQVHVNRCDDFGPATKLLGALAVERDPEARIIVVDDDVLYPPGMVDCYSTCELGRRDAVFCTAGFDIADPLGCRDDVRGKLLPVRGHMVPVQVVEAYGSILYRRGLFDDDIFDIFDSPDCVVYSDDLYFSNYLGRRGICRRTVAFPGFGGDGFWKGRVMDYGREGDALHLAQDVGSNRERYARAIRYFLEAGNYWLAGENSNLTDLAGAGKI